MLPPLLTLPYPSRPGPRLRASCGKVLVCLGMRSAELPSGAGRRCWPALRPGPGKSFLNTGPTCGWCKTEAHASAFGSYTFPSLFRQSAGLPLRLPFGNSILSAGGSWEVSLKWDGVGPRPSRDHPPGPAVHSTRLCSDHVTCGTQSPAKERWEAGRHSLDREVTPSCVRK